MAKNGLWLSVLACAAFPAMAADPATIDWTKIPSTAVMLFYPGQSSYEWLRRNDHGKGKGAKAAREGSACIKCHDGDERSMGESVVKGGTLEPAPVKGKNGSLELKVQSAGRGRRLFPYNQVLVRIAPVEADRTALQAVFEGLPERVREPDGRDRGFGEGSRGQGNGIGPGVHVAGHGRPI